MGFFQENAKFGSGGDYAVADDGVYTCRFKEIETLKQPSFDDASVLEDKFKFVFETVDEVDNENNPFRFVKFTKTSYGYEKAALTILIDGMLGRHLTEQEFLALDLDDLKAKKFKVVVELTKNQSGKEINKILSVKPMKPAGEGAKMGNMNGVKKKPTPEVPDQEEEDLSEDPFADD